MITLIVPTDFSDYAYNALFYATRLVPKEKCKILLVHSYEKELADRLSVLNPKQNESAEKTLRAEVYQKLESLEHRILLDSKGIELIVECFYGPHELVLTINEMIENLEVHCIVMGTKGATGLKEVFIGSQAVDALKRVNPIPVFLISKNADFRLPKNIAYATDFAKDYEEQYFSFLKPLVKDHNAALNVCHVYDPIDTHSGVEPHYQKLEKQLSDVKFTMHWIANNNGIENDLSQFCEEQDIDLLTLTYHKYSFIKKLIKTSLVEKAGFHLDIPLLILPDLD